MKSIIFPSGLLAGLVAVVSVAVAVSGLHESSPTGSQFAFLLPVIAINIGCIIWSLRLSREDHGYLRQVLNGALVGLLGGALIFGFSMLLTTVLMPGYLDEVTTATIDWVNAQPLPDEVRAAQIAQLEATTPASQALAGFMGTLGTSVVSALIAAIFLRRKS